MLRSLHTALRQYDSRKSLPTLGLRDRLGGLSMIELRNLNVGALRRGVASSFPCVQIRLLLPDMRGANKKRPASRALQCLLYNQLVVGGA
jgi:hypothetical protein